MLPSWKLKLTWLPGSSPVRSRSALGITTRPAELIVEVMGQKYHHNFQKVARRGTWRAGRQLGSSRRPTRGGLPASSWVPPPSPMG